MMQRTSAVVPTLLVLLQFTGHHHSSHAIPLVDAKVCCRDSAVKYLVKFGYLEDKATADNGAFAEAVAHFQREVGLSDDGQVGPNTLAVMKQPRCGNKDVEVSHGKTRRKRFVAHEKKWPRSVLTWKVEDPHHILKTYDLYVVRNAMNRAFDNWASASKYSLRFRELGKDVPFPADITIFFASGFHNDTLPFDGRNGIVAHGFYPTNGNLHFDADERWTLNMDHGINLYQTAVHEIGHLLGLQHSADHRAVMFPINRPYDPDYTLADDDVRGIRYLYTPWSWNYYVQRYLERWHHMAQESNNVIRKS